MSQGLSSDVNALPDGREAEWQDVAACAGAARELFFAPLIKEGRWRPFCASCPVVDVCFWSSMVEEEADDSGYRFGVRGGAPPSVRRKVAAVSYPGYARSRLAQALAAWRQFRAESEEAVSAGDVGAEAAGF